LAVVIILPNAAGQNLHMDTIAQPSLSPAPPPLTPGRILRRQIQSRLFPAIDNVYPPLTHRLRLWYNVKIARGEPELGFVPSVIDRTRAALDIGAHRGIYANVLARYATHVHAFEPHPSLCAYLKSVMPPKVTVHPVALSSEEGSVTFRIPRGGGYLGLGQGTLEAKPIFHVANVSEIEVRASRLDNEIHEPVGFIKIDVEGHELSALKGGQELLARDHPVLMVEVADTGELHHYTEVTSFLADFGYRPYWLERGALVGVSRRGPQDAFTRVVGPEGEILFANFFFLA
jgi:FkbM family methyltransferase